MPSPENAVEARPWRESDGPKPRVWTWQPADRPALWVRISGAWRHASVVARQDWPDGRTAYQVLLGADGSTPMSHCSYW